MKARERAEAEWARERERVEGRTRVEAFNDRALEILIALARWYAVVGGVLLAWTAPLLAWWLGWSGVLLAGGHAVLVGVSGWWGWWHMGNKGWIDGQGQ